MDKLIPRAKGQPVTVAKLKALKINECGKWITDGRGIRFRARQLPSDTSIVVDFCFRITRAGKQSEISLGTWPTVSLATIRSKRDEIAENPHPVMQRQIDRTKLQANIAEALALEQKRLHEATKADSRTTLRELFNIWLGLELSKRKDRGAEALRAFEKDVFPLLGSMAIEDIKKAHIQRVLDDMQQRKIVRMTKRVFSDLRQLFRFGLKRDYIEADPTAALDKKDLGVEKTRDRALSESELTQLFKRLGASGLPDHTQIALSIQLATLARIGEVALAQWQHVELDQCRWTMPTTKNGKAHVVYLSDFAVEQFTVLQALTGGGDYCFPNRTLSAAIDPKAFTKQVADRQRQGKALPNRTKQVDGLVLTGGPWQTHDLRRTGATQMAEHLQIMPEVIERCLNHTDENRMKAIYQRAAYAEPMRAAWAAWGDRLALLKAKVDGKAENITMLHRA